MVNALTAGSSSLLSSDPTAFLMNRIAGRLYADMTKEVTAVETKYNPELQSILARRGTVVGRLKEVQNVLDGVKNAETQIEEIRQVLRDMKVMLSKAKTTTSATAKEFYAKQFNENLKKLNEVADQYAAEYNLIGRADERTLLPETKELSSDYGTTTDIDTLYGGSSFNLIGTNASEGEYYQNDPSGNFMSKVESLGAEDPLFVIAHGTSMFETITIDRDANTIEFKLNSSDGNGDEFEGTIQKGGLGLMPAWYYNDFEDDAGIDAAREAVNDAFTQLNRVSFSVTMAEAKVKPIATSLEAEKKSLLDDFTATSRLMDDKIADIEDEARREFNAIESSLNAQSGALSGYQRILAQVGGGGSFVNILG
ncbi:hypothetical protein [uncultured Rhodospira sp.]|uniref:hypothetical protein n=1 Tax=uncultured Rhodospira sp. TaxID=1936189 RepID=UPI002634DAEA|nr:hypothetical protein [uncultured Rhodospira sp.]